MEDAGVVELALIGLLTVGAFLLLVVGGLLCVAYCSASIYARTRGAAEARAEMLLSSLLTREQNDYLVRRGYFELPSPSNPNRHYRIPRGGGRVRIYERGVPITALCVQPLEPIPEADVLLMHKLMIEGDEEEYLRLANHVQIVRPAAPFLATR